MPELARVPLAYLAEPWTMPPKVQQLARCRIGEDCSAPIVDEKSALCAAKERMYGLCARAEACQEVDSVEARHGSRKSGLPSTPRKEEGRRRTARHAEAAAPGVQGNLFA